MRILMLNYEFPPIGGGGATSTFFLARHLAQLGHEVDVVTMSARGARRCETVGGITIYRVPSLRSRPEICHTREMVTYVLTGLFQAARLASSRAYDVTHAHFIVPTGPIACALRRLSRLPYVLTARGSDVPGHNPDRFQRDHALLSPAWRYLVRDADAVTALTHDLRRRIQRLVPAVTVHVIPNGVSALSTRRGDTLDSVPVAERARRVLVATRLHPFKGVQYLLEAVARQRLHYELHIVGDGPYRQPLEELATRLGVRARFWGWLDRGRPELGELYRRCGIFVLPSEREGASAALLEAMAEGLAIIATDSTGAPELVGPAGLLVPPRDSAGLAAALETFSRNPRLVAEYGQRARERVQTHFDWNVVAERYTAVYRAVRVRAFAAAEGRTPRRWIDERGEDRELASISHRWRC